jgi:hypothetical protein
MYNLLISLGVASVAFLLGFAGGQWYYGFAPALIVFPVVYFLLARRTGKQVEAIMAKAMSELQTQRMDAAKETMRSALVLGRWQFLVGQQIYAQMGALEYVQRKPKAAREHLEKAWSRNWQAQAMLAVLDAKKGDHPAGIKRLGKARLFARKEPVFWGILSWLHLRNKDPDTAMTTVKEGIDVTDGAKPLKELDAAIANDRVKRFKWDKVFGQSWYQFFPEQMPMQRMQAAANKGRKTFPQPRGGRGR